MMIKKKNIKIAIVLITFIILILLSNNIYAIESVYTNSNTNYKVVIEDDADLLTYIEEMQLLEEMKELTEYGNIIFKSIDSNSSYSTAAFAKSYYNTNFGSNSGTLFLIDMKYRKIYIFSNGKNYNSVTTAKAELITDNIYKMATNKQYYECAKEAYSQILSVLKGEKIAQPMKYICNALIAYILSQFIIFFIITKILNNKKANNTEIIKNVKSRVQATKPEVKYLSTSKRYDPIESSSSSGGGGFSGGRRWPEEAEDIAFKLFFA